MKRGPMSNADKLFIVQNKSKSLKFLSKKLNRTEESIQEFINSLNESKEEDSLQGEQELKREPKPQTQISSSLARNKKYGAVVMTPTASMISDENRKKRTNSKNSKNYIFIMNPVEE